jgi:DHA1 family bicyclomycin/chloramphenicol resistance-like MFS transporter
MIATLAGLVCLSAASIDVSMPAIPMIAEDLGSTTAGAQLSITFYLLGYALAQIPIGLLSDRFGRRPPLFVALIVFVAAGLAGAMAGQIEVLLAARLVQGLAGASGPLLARAIVRDTSEGHRLSQRMSLLVTALGVSTLAAPVIGASLSEFFGWRATLYASALLGAVLGLLALRLVPETRPTPVARVSPWTQFRASARAFFAEPQCWIGGLLLALPFAGFMAIVVSTSPILVNRYGLPVGAVGPIFAVAVLSYIASAALSRRLVARLGVARLLAVSVLAFGLAAAVLAVLIFIEHPPLAILGVGVMAYLFGIGMIMPNATTIALAPIPEAAGFGSAILGTGQVGASAAGSAIVATLLGGGVTGLAIITAAAGLLTVAAYALGARRISVGR